MKIRNRNSSFSTIKLELGKGNRYYNDNIKEISIGFIDPIFWYPSLSDWEWRLDSDSETIKLVYFPDWGTDTNDRYVYQENTITKEQYEMGIIDNNIYRHNLMIANKLLNFGIIDLFDKTQLRRDNIELAIKRVLSMTDKNIEQYSTIGEMYVLLSAYRRLY